MDLATLRNVLANDEVFGLASQAMRDMIGSGVSDREDVEFLTNCGYGGGGGVCFVMNQIPQRALADVIMADTVVKENEAVNGGKLPNYS